MLNNSAAQPVKYQVTIDSDQMYIPGSDFEVRVINAEDFGKKRKLFEYGDILICSATTDLRPGDLVIDLDTSQDIGVFVRRLRLDSQIPTYRGKMICEVEYDLSPQTIKDVREASPDRFQFCGKVIKLLRSF